MRACTIEEIAGIPTTCTSCIDGYVLSEDRLSCEPIPNCGGIDRCTRFVCLFLCFFLFFDVIGINHENM